MPLLTSPTQAPVRGHKRRLAVIATALAMAFCGLAAWTAAHHDGQAKSGAGCVSVTIPSSMGGALLHQCGANARATCRHAFRSHDRLSLVMRPPCRSAGLH